MKEEIIERLNGIKIIIEFMKEHGEKGMDVILKELEEVFKLLGEI